MHFLTPVWGEAYVRLFLDLAIPAQLAPHNLPSLAGDPGAKYIIYTTAADRETICASPIFQRLRAIVSVTFEPVDLTLKITHDRMSECYRRGIAAADSVGAGVVFLTPDIVFADGSLGALKRLAERGYDAVFVPAIRTLMQGVAATICDRFRVGETIQISPRDLMRTALDNLHPLADLSWWDEGETDLLPANLYWRVGDDGIVARCFHLHPVYVRPQRPNARFFGTVDDDFCSAACPDRSKDYVVCDSDEFLAIELSDPSHYFRTGFRKGSVKDAATWAEQFANERHRALFDHTIRMHTGMSRPDLWSKTTTAADRVADAIKARLAIPTWRLLMPPSAILLRRAYRQAFDRQLRLANRSPATSPAQAFGLRLASFFNRWPLWVLRAYRSLRVLLRRALDPAGLTRPLFFTSDFLLQVLLRRDFGVLATPLERAVLISDDMEASPIRTLLTGEHVTMPLAVLVSYQGAPHYVSRDAGVSLQPASYDLMIVELADARDLPKHVAAAEGLLAPNGRLLLCINRFLLSKRTNVQKVDKVSIEQLLGPRYSICEHRVQGGAGSALKLGLFSKIEAAVRRGPVLIRLAELAFAWLWIPLYVIFGTLCNILALIGDILDRERSNTVTSLTLAAKVPVRPERRAPASIAATAL